MFSRLLGKVINTSIGRSNYWAAVVGLGIAFLLILAATQLHFTFRHLLANSNSGSDEYLVVSKNITNDMIGDLQKSTFTPAEIEEVKKQPFFDSVGIMVSSRFRVKLKVPSNSLPLSTDMFFEAVPDEFLDIKPEGWGWKPGDNYIPGIMPRMLLDLYNFGFAVGQRLPQISEESVRTLPLEFTITDNSENEVKIMGRVAGFSERINSILIPMSFMKWANERYGFKDNVQPGRLIVHTKNPSDSKLNAFLESKNYSTNAGVTRFSRIRGIVDIIVKTISFIGLIMFAFALVVFTLFIRLTIANARTEIQLLVTLGASPKQLGRFIMNKVFPPYVVVGIITLAAVAIIQYIIAHLKFFTSQNVFMKPWLAPGTAVVAVLMLAVIWFINYRTIHKYIKSFK